MVKELNGNEVRESDRKVQKRERENKMKWNIKWDKGK